MSNAMNAEACKTLERLGYEWKSLDGRHWDWYGPAVKDSLTTAAPAAPAAQAVADDVVRDYPEGWVFHSADFSMAASCPARSGRVTLVRDLPGRDWWVSLSEEDKDRFPLYVYGSGNTLSDAIKDAALLAAQQQKAGGAE